MRRAEVTGAAPKGKVLVVGASGVIGQAAIEHFVAAGWDVVGCSRRLPRVVGAELISVDLDDAEQCRHVFGAMSDVTHVVYAALVEAPGLIAGWQDRQLMDRNLSMFRNVIDVIVERASELAHICLLALCEAAGLLRPNVVVR